MTGRNGDEGPNALGAQKWKIIRKNIDLFIFNGHHIALGVRC